VHLVDIILDNRVSCSFIETSDVENTIFCRPLEESLDNISVITTKDSEFIHNYIEESAGNYLVTDITLEDGTVYENVRFAIVIIESGKDLPACTINLSSLGAPSAFDVLPSVSLLEEAHILVTEEEKEDDYSVLYSLPEVKDTTELVKK